MPRRGEGFAGRCRAAWQKMGPERTWTPDDLADAVDLRSYVGKRKISTVLRDAVRRGELERVGPGRYRACRIQQKPLGKDRMWSILRMRRRATVDDLAELAGVGRSYAKEYLSALVRADVVRTSEGLGRRTVYEVVQADQVSTPASDTAAKLRDLRARHKRAAEALVKAMEALEVARAELEE